MVKRFSLELQNKELNVVFNLPEYAYVEGDVMMLERVVQNLLSNAIKYTPRGNIILISAIEKEENYLISIENKGITIDNVFARFYRLDKSGDRTKNSYGLGLATVKRILTLHNSNFLINNGENSVIFSFTLKKQDLISSDEFEI